MFFKDLADGIKAVFTKKTDADNAFRLDGRVPLKRAMPFGLQHVLAMFVSNVTPLLIVFGAMGLYGSKLATEALTGALFTAGIGTIIQLLVGARLPVVVGTSFTYVGVFITIGLSHGGGEAGYYVILGSALAGGFISAVLCLFVKWWGRAIKPIVPCVVVLAIGLSLLNSGATQFLGGSGVIDKISKGVETAAPYYAYPVVAAVTLVSGILWQIFAKGVYKSLNIVFGLIAGYIVCLFIPGIIDFSALNVKSVSDVISYPKIIDVTKLRFDFQAIMLTTVFYLMSVAEGIGGATAICKNCLERDPTDREITGTVVTVNVDSCLCSLFGALPVTVYAQNVGIVTQTKIINRFTLFTGAVFLTVASFFPIVSDFLLTIPDAVMGGTIVTLFGSIAVVGMEMCAKQGFSPKNVLILSLSICLGYGITTVTGLFDYLKSINLNYLAGMLSNNVLNMFVISVVLSLVLPDDMDFSFKKKK